MDKRKTHVALCWDELGEGAKWGVFFDGDAEPFAYLTEAPEARVLPWLKEANAAPALAETLEEPEAMKKKKYKVTVTRVEYFSADVIVEAENEEEAKEQAICEADFGNCHNAEQDVDYIAELTD